MSGKVIQRVTSNPTAGFSSDVNERILKSCYELYTAKETGIFWFIS